MNKSVKHLLTGALVTGLLSGAAALAEDQAAQSDDASGQMSSGKNGCHGKSAKQKNSCKGQAKGKKGKNSCGGKDGCGEKDKK